MKKYLFLLLIPYISSASDPDMQVGFGFSLMPKSNYYSLNIGDFNHFKQNSSDSVFKTPQYGYGRSQFEVGNGIGVNLSAISGTQMYGLGDNERGMSPFLGMELGGRIQLNSADSVNNYYIWHPGIGVGLQTDLGGIRLLGLLRTGAAAETYDRSGILPSFNYMWGYGFNLNTNDLGFSADAIYYGFNRIYGIDTAYKFDDYNVDFRLETLSNVNSFIQENRGYFMIKFKF